MIITALVPIFILILLGFLISRTTLVSTAMWPELERLTYYFFFPALLILRLAASNFDWQDIREIAQVVGLAIFGMTLFVFIVRKLIASDPSSLSSVYQGSIRFNTYIGLACIDALYGDRGLTTAALCLAVYIPLVNVLSVISLSLHGNGGPNRWANIFSSTLSNPLVLACVVGVGISYTGYQIPDLAESVVSLLTLPALPLGLLAVGAGIQFTALGTQGWQLMAAVFNKMLLFPALTLGACLLFDTGTALATILIILSVLPAPPSAFILARQLGGNVSLMANIITVQTIVAFVAIPFWLQMSDRYLSLY